jgi:hypothetical protein
MSKPLGRLRWSVGGERSNAAMSLGSVGSKSAPAAAVRPELRIHPEAAEEYEAARAWYETESPKLGMEFEAELGQIIERILAGVPSSR